VVRARITIGSLIVAAVLLTAGVVGRAVPRVQSILENAA